MDNKEFIQKLKAITQIRTVYMWGTFGAPVSEKLISDKTKQYPAWYNASKQRQLRDLIGRGYFAFDCIGLIKAILWGWDGSTKTSHGGAVYQSNGMPDTNANGYINMCKNVSSDFSKIEPGEAVWMNGHIGVYIGNGEVIESTPAWRNGVQTTKLSARKWLKHGFMPQVEYNENSEPISNDGIKVDGYMGPETIKALQGYFGTIQDGKISTQSMMVRELQKGLGVAVDGILGPVTIKALQKHLGTTQDGVISRPSAMVKSLQDRLNKGNLNLKTVKSVEPPKAPEPARLVEDGLMGPATIKRLQEYLGTPVDGVISTPSSMIKELQRRLNNKKL